MKRKRTSSPPPSSSSRPQPQAGTQMKKRKRSPWDRFGNLSLQEATCGDGKLVGDVGAAEYPCVRRLRYRRLFALLYLQGFGDTFEAMLDESNVLLSEPRLTGFVRRGQWQDACDYLARFLAPPDSGNRPSVEALVLHYFLRAHQTLDRIVAGLQAEAAYLDHGNKTPLPYGTIRLRCIALNLMCSQKARDSINWDRVRELASNYVMVLLYLVPELTESVVLPGGPKRPHNILPIAHDFVLRRSCRPKKQAPRRPEAPALAKHYLRTLRRLPDSPGPSLESYDGNKNKSKAMSRVADIVDACLKGSIKIPLQTSATNGHVTGTNSPFMGTMRNPALPTLFGNSTSYYGNSGIGLMANTGATVPPVTQTMFSSLTCPAVNTEMPSGVIVTVPPVSQTTFRSLECPAVNTKMPSGATIPPVSQTMFRSLTVPAVNAKMLSGANAGATVPPVSQTMFSSMAAPAVNTNTLLVANTGATAAPISPWLSEWNTPVNGIRL